jgi:hypothetical protein
MQKLTKEVGMKKSTLAAIIAGNLVIINAILYVLTEVREAANSYGLISNIIEALCAMTAALGLFVAFRVLKKWDLTKTSWMLLFIGMGLYALAEVVYASLAIVFHVNSSEIFPTAADYVWTLGYIPLCAGIGILYHSYTKSGFAQGSKKFYLGLTAFLLVFAAALVCFLFMPILKDHKTSMVAKALYLFYPTADIFLIANALSLVYITRFFGVSLVSRPWKCIAFGFMFITAADVAYSYLNWTGQYSPGSVIDMGWNTGYLLIGLAGFYQKELIDSINSRGVK